jgi:polyisoprenoid-binding protein YceI
MKRILNAVLLTAIAATAAPPFVKGRLAAWVTSAPQKAVKVSYAPIPGGEYKFDPAHSTIGFAIRHNEINWVSGRFKDFVGTLRYDEGDVTTSSVEFTAKVASIDTGVTNRDNHLRTADFFEVAKYPELTFKSTRVERKKNGYVLHGDLTLKDVTRQVAIPFTLTGAIKDARGNTRFGVDGSTTIDRRDYGITWGKALEGGGFDVGHEVKISLQLEVVKPAPKPAGQ